METKKNACCVFGHRKIAEDEELKVKLTEIMEELIVKENVDTFFLGSRSQFDSLCCDVLCHLKEKYPHIHRVYVRAEYPVIGPDYEKYLLKWCDETYFPKKAENSGRAVCFERNCEMIDRSEICIVYYREEYLPSRRKQGRHFLSDYQPKSGTSLAYQYAVQKKRRIINLAK